MKIDLNAIDREQFMVHQHLLNGEVIWLVQPQHIGCKWTQANKHLRSSVWNNDGELISAGFGKFVNWGENPDNFPVPESLKDTTVVEKVDGSLLIVSKYKGQYILRTRGTVDATKLDNGAELELFHKQFANGLKWETPSTWNVSLLFEWVSPKQKIILNYGDQPDWYMVGIVNHHDYSLHNQKDLDMWANNYGFKRPPSYVFPSLEDLMKTVEEWKGKEGIVIYSKHDQVLHKVKAASYLFLHRMKSELGSIDKIIDVWFNMGHPPYQAFEKHITETFDFELWNMIRPDASRICDAYKQVGQIVDGMKKFVEETLRPMATRREQAERVISSYGNTNRAAFVFTLLDSKPLNSEQEKKLLYQCLKK